VRNVGTESQRTYQNKLDSGFFDKYMSGVGLDIGYAGYVEGSLAILDTATGIDLGYPGYDGVNLPFTSESQDYVYSSHCLEHILHYKDSLYEWFRVLKIGGCLIITVPHQYLYEKKLNLPSVWNEGHLRFYTPSSLLKEIEESLQPNSYRVRLLEDGDFQFNYNVIPPAHSEGQYEITLVIQRIKTPEWEMK
jgi:SAM-dependent methyltransferase